MPCIVWSTPLEWLPVIDRILLVSWLLKDFGWMTTNVFLGFPFGIVSVSLHFFLLLFDPRRTYTFYNLSLLLWVMGNFVWMTVEFFSTHPSSHIHVGPPVPLGGMSDQTTKHLVNAKTVLFLLSSSLQLLMYLLIHYRVIPVPEDEEEDLVSKNEAVLFFYGHRSFDQQWDQPTISTLHLHFPDELVDGRSPINGPSTAQPIYGITLTYIENAYILFWISKDLFWSWGTGDLTRGKDLAIFFESLALSFGMMSIFIYILTAYLYRRNLLRFLDSITTVLWIMANYVWMCGEFFIRYDNLTYDDEDSGDDSNTRIASTLLFCCGILLQSYILLSILCPSWSFSIRRFSRTSTVQHIELAPMKGGFIRYSSLVTVVTPQGDDNKVEASKQKFRLGQGEEDEFVLYESS